MFFCKIFYLFKLLYLKTLYNKSQELFTFLPTISPALLYI
jgi:hypothetical protein